MASSPASFDRGRVRALGLLALVLGLFAFGGLPDAERRTLEQALKTGSFVLTPASAVQAVRAYLSNPDDMLHFHAYAQATLGRPYRAHYVRTRAGWEASFVPGTQSDPRATPLVTPPAPLRPYRDFLVEYPPGFFLVLVPPALAGASADAFTLAFKLQSVAYLLLALFFAVRLARAAGVAAPARLPHAFALAVFALGVVATHRFDAFVAAMITGAVLAAARGRAAPAGVLLGLGVAAKGVPALVAPLLLAYLFSAHGRRAAIHAALALALSAGGLFVVAWVYAGPGIWDAFAYHANRPVHIESTAGALLALAHAVTGDLVTVVYSYSSRNLRGDPVALAGAVTGALVLATLVVVTLLALARLARAADPRARLCALIDGAVALLGVYVTLGRVFCPQYLLWLLPLGLVAAFAPGRSPRRPLYGLALLAATHLIYPIAYAQVKALAPWASALVLARNLGVLAFALTLVRAPEAAAFPGLGRYLRALGWSPPAGAR